MRTTSKSLRGVTANARIFKFPQGPYGVEHRSSHLLMQLCGSSVARCAESVLQRGLLVETISKLPKQLPHRDILDALLETHGLLLA